MAVQSMGLGHQVDHLNADDRNQCSVCSLSNGLDVPVVVSHVPPEVETYSLATAHDCRFVLLEANYSPSTARAPPFYL
jgi:hypothetical protein